MGIRDDVIHAFQVVGAFGPEAPFVRMSTGRPGGVSGEDVTLEWEDADAGTAVVFAHTEWSLDVQGRLESRVLYSVVLTDVPDPDTQERVRAVLRRARDFHRVTADPDQVVGT